MSCLTSRRAAIALIAALGLPGCVSVPPDLEADMQPPDGARPNNYGRLVDGPAGPIVRPDRPTVVAATRPVGGGPR